MAETAIVASKQRNQVFKSMNPETQQVARELEAKISKVSNGIVVLQYQMGMRIAKVVEEEQVYGEGAVKQLADYLNNPGGATHLYNLKNFATTFTKDYVERTMERSMESGERLSVGHWIALSRIDDGAKREKMLERVFKHSMSANDLVREVTASGSGKNVRQGGRKPQTPTSPTAGLQKTHSIAQQLNRFSEVAYDNVFGVIDEMDSEKMNETLLEKLEETKATLEETMEEAPKMIARIEKNIKRVTKVLAKKEKESLKDLESEDEDDSKAKKKKAKASDENEEEENEDEDDDRESHRSNGKKKKRRETADVD